MKKLLGILVLGLLWCNVGFAIVAPLPIHPNVLILLKSMAKA